jgi:hypothetical protein
MPPVREPHSAAPAEQPFCSSQGQFASAVHSACANMYRFASGPIVSSKNADWTIFHKSVASRCSTSSCERTLQRLRRKPRISRIARMGQRLRLAKNPCPACFIRVSLRLLPPHARSPRHPRFSPERPWPHSLGSPPLPPSGMMATSKMSSRCVGQGRFAAGS